MQTSSAFVFVTGGTVQAGGGVYLARGADRELLDQCRAGNFSYILTSRQMGKSSLMIRTAECLAAEGTTPVIVDLTGLGIQTTAEQWYKGLLFTIGDQLGLKRDVGEWWSQQPDHSLAQRFTRYLREVVLVERRERIVLFIDEIDTTLRLDFTDDFFAAIRFLYQGRAADLELSRLSFVLIGVATPGDLIKDAARTPFNIGKRIELTDFTFDEVLPLADYLTVAPTAARDLLGWILKWTGGHPYLTLRVVRSFAESPPAEWTEKAVDDRIHELFFGPQGESESNLQFVRDMLTKKAFEREAVLRTYGHVRSGVSVPDNELDLVASWLKLSGVVGRKSGLLKVRNAVYERVFDEAWVRHHLRLHVNWRRRLTRVASVLLVLTVLITIPLAFYAWLQKEDAEAQRDTANRLRALTERSLSERDAEKAILERALEAIEKVDPEVGADLARQVATERETASRELGEATKGLRSERDELLKKQRIADQQISSLRAEIARLTDRLSSVPDMAMPNLVGINIGQAKGQVGKLQLTASPIVRESSTSPADIVLKQWPYPGTRVSRGSAVYLVVSNGRPPAGEVVGRTSTDEDGSFARRIAAGTYDVRFQARGYGTVLYQDVRVTATDGARMVVSIPAAGTETTVVKGFSAGRAGTIEGIVRDPSGAPIPKIGVIVLRRERTP
jgi:AAA-like domain/PASTA domain